MGENFFGMDGFIRGITQGATDADGIVVTQITSYFTYNHRNSVGGKPDSHSRVKIINGFDQTDAADLKEVIYIFMVAGKAFDDT